MLWTKLPDNWFSLSAQEKFFWYSNNSKLITEISRVSSDTFFLDCNNCHGGTVADITEYDFAYAIEIQEAIKTSIEGLIHDDGGIIDRLTSAELLKKSPIKTYLHGNAKADAVAPKTVDPISTPKNQGKKPPEFHYPL